MYLKICWSSQQTFLLIFFHMSVVKACTNFFHQPQLHQSKILTTFNLLFLPLKTQKKYPTIQDIFPFFYSITPVIKKRWADLHWCVSFKSFGFHHCLPVLFENNLVESIFWNPATLQWSDLTLQHPAFFKILKNPMLVQKQTIPHMKA